MTPHNLTMTMIGASMLWFGWFGFNAGSGLEANGFAGLAFINTYLATACAVLSWTFAEWIFKGKPSMLGAASGAVAGLVAITPAAGNEQYRLLVPLVLLVTRSRRDRDETRNRTAAPSIDGLPLKIHSANVHDKTAQAVARYVLMNANPANPFASRTRAGVEPEPAEPEHRSADHRHGQIVRSHRLLAVTEPLAEHERAGAACEIERTPLPDQTGRRVQVCNVSARVRIRTCPNHAVCATGM